MGRSRRLGRERRGRDGRSPPPGPPHRGNTRSTAGGRELSARSPPPCCFNSDVTPWDGSRFGLDKKSRVWLNAGSVGNEKNTVNKKDRADPLTYSLNPTNFGLTLGVHFIGRACAGIIRFRRGASSSRKVFRAASFQASAAPAWCSRKPPHHESLVFPKLIKVTRSVQNLKHLDAVGRRTVRKPGSFQNR
jgi:hypothetical protein